MTVRDLVEAYPATLSILAPLGIDLCCGGAYQLGEALERHGIDNREEIIDWLARAIGATAPKPR
jgi:iron-sulfur cluster repair protein YtfE (RIC family)